jgi:hypothetical protein
MLTLDLSLVKKMIEDPSTITTLQDAGVVRDMFFDEGQEAYDFVLDFYKEYSKMPDAMTLSQNVGVVMEGDTPEPVEYYVDKLVTRWKGNTVGGAMEKAADALSKGDPDEALSLIAAAASEVKAISGDGMQTMINITDPSQVEDRLRQYEKLKSLSGEIDGIPTPWPTINGATRGIHKDELWVILGKLKTGKTWAEIAMAIHAWQEGDKNVLLVSEEMGIDKMARRWDAVYSKLPYGDFVSGLLATEVEEHWRKKMEALKGKGNFWVVGKQRVRTTGDLELIMDELDPDICFVDGAYFLSVDGAKGASKWDRTSGVIDELQSLVQRKQRPIVVSWQFNRKVKTNKTEGTAEDVAFAYEVSQNADAVIGFFRSEDLRIKKQMLMKLIECREGEQVPDILLKWDFDNMQFDEIGTQEGDEIVSNTTEQMEISY